MELVKIEDDRVTIELDPRDCWWLSEACAAAGAYLVGDTALARHFGFGSRGADGADVDGDAEARQVWYEALAAGLKAATVAAEDEYLAGGEYHPTLDYVRRRYAGQGERFPKDDHEADGPEDGEAPPAA